MEHIDIIVLTSVVATLFIVFFIAIYKEVRSIDVTKPDYSKEAGPRAQMIQLIGNMFDDSTTTKKERKAMLKAVNRTIADMESDGMYFPQEVREKLKEMREELNCEYSGLPSVKSYDTK